MAKGDIEYIDLRKDDSGNFLLRWDEDTSTSKNQWARQEHSKVFKESEGDLALQSLIEVYKKKLKIK